MNDEIGPSAWAEQDGGKQVGLFTLYKSGYREQGNNQNAYQPSRKPLKTIPSLQTQRLIEKKQRRIKLGFEQNLLLNHGIFQRLNKKQRANKFDSQGVLKRISRGGSEAKKKDKLYETISSQDQKAIKIQNYSFNQINQKYKVQALKPKTYQSYLSLEATPSGKRLCVKDELQKTIISRRSANNRMKTIKDNFSIKNRQTISPIGLVFPSHRYQTLESQVLRGGSLEPQAASSLERSGSLSRSGNDSNRYLDCSVINLTQRDSTIKKSKGIVEQKKVKGQRVRRVLKSRGNKKEIYRSNLLLEYQKQPKVGYHQIGNQRQKGSFSRLKEVIQNYLKTQQRGPQSRQLTILEEV